MDEGLWPAEVVREALLKLYDPIALTGTPLAAQLNGRGVPSSFSSVADTIVEAIEALKPSDGAPPQSHGWRCYRYLQLRYVECQSHASVAQDLGVSLRQASRVHLDALNMLGRALLPTAPDARSAGHAAARVSAGGTALRSDLAPAPPSVGSSIEAQLTTAAVLPQESGVGVVEIVQGVLSTFQRYALAHQITIEQQHPATLPPARINRIALRQILFNLLVHLANTAHDRQPQSADSLTITLSTALRSGSVVLSFRYEVGHSVPDTAPAEAESGTADRSDSPLAAAQVMARAHGAVITGLRREPPAVGLELAVPVGTHVILLIDDNPYVGNLFRRMLATSHYDLVHARTASRALSMARETPPQGIILDVVMPTRDGWEILTALKLDRRTAAIPVIVCSVLPDRELALSLGASDFLAKPVTRATLRTALDRALQSRPHPLLSDV